MAPIIRRSLQFVVFATFAAFLIVTVDVTLDPVLSGKSFERLEPSATTDAFLRILDAPQPGMLVEGGLRRYAPDKTMLFVANAKQVFSGQVYYTVAYLAYPRPVPAIICAEPGKNNTNVIEKVTRSAPIDGLIFFDTDPGPWAAGGTWVTPKLYIAPHSGTATWESFCR